MVTVSIDNEKCHDCHDTGTTPDLVYLHESNQWVEDGVRKCHCQEPDDFSGASDIPGELNDR
jgi:hypothetical protein